MNSEFRIDGEEMVQGVFMLRLSGDLDSRSASVLIRSWRQERRPDRVMVIHLAGIQFVSSSGIGALLAIVEESNDSGEAVHLMAPSTNVLSVIKLLGLDRFLPVLNDESSLPMRKAG